MSQEMKPFFSKCYLGVVLLILCPLSATYAQPQTAMTRGPISFGRLQNPRFEKLGNTDRNGCPALRFKWTATGGQFSYDLSDTQAVLHGSIRNFRLEGVRTEQVCRGNPSFEVDPGSLSFEFTPFTDTRLQLYGGTITIPSGTSLEITNTQKIIVSGSSTLNQVGNLRLIIPRGLNWRSAKFKFANLPEQIALDLTSAPGKNTLIDLPLTNGQLRVFHASFLYSLPAELAQKKIDIVDPTYRATLNNLALNTLVVDLDSNGLSLKAQDLSAAGEITGRVVKSAPVPILFTGRASVTKLRGSAEFSTDVATVENVLLSELNLERQRPPIIAKSPPIRRLNVASKGEVSFRQAGFVDEAEARIAKPLFDHAPPPAPCSSNSSSTEFAAATPAQNSSIESMGMTTLTQRQTRAIKASNQSLQQIGLSNFAVNYPCSDFRPLAEQFLKRKGLKLIDMVFGPQEALLIVDAVDGPKLPEAMKFSYRLSPTVEEGVDPETNKPRQELVVRYNFAVGTVDDLRVPGDTTPDNVLSDFSGQVGKADEAATDEASTLRFRLPMDVTKEVDLNKKFTDPTNNSTGTVESKRMNVKVAATACSILVDQIGIHVLSELGLNPARVGCSPIQEGPEVTFNNFLNAFQDKMKADLGAESIETWDKVSTYISRKFLSSALTQVFNDAEVHISAEFPRQPLSPQPKPLPLTIPRNEINCDLCFTCSGGGPKRWACEGARGACLAMPQNISFRVACEAEKALQNSLAGTEIGSIEFAIQANASLNRSRLKLNLDEALTNARVEADIRATAAAGGTLTLRLVPAAKALTACVTDTTFNLPDAQASVASSALPLTASFENKTSQQGLDFQLSINNMRLDAELEISSVLSAVLSRPENFVTCSLPAKTLALAGAVVDTLPRSYKREFNFSENLKSLSVGRLTVDIPGRVNPMILTPRASTLSLGVVEVSTP